MTPNNQKQGTIEIVAHESEILKNNPLGDKSDRELIVYLPPDYEVDSSAKFPTVYLLAGFAGRGRMMLNDNAFSPNIAQRLDNLIHVGTIKPFIAVMPDGFTYFGGSQYLNSSATGNYEDYLMQEIVPFVDTNFRTIDERNSRAVMGKSSGGYGALMLSMKYPETFGLCASISGDCYFEHCYLPDIPKAFRAIKENPQKFLEKFFAEEKKGKNDFSAFNIIGMSACYSPNPASELGFELPFDVETGEIREEIWQKWLAHDPVRLAEKYTENLKSLKLLFLDAGTRDEFALDLGARILSKRLKELNIAHIHEEFDDGHFNINYRLNRSFEIISNAFSAH